MTHLSRIGLVAVLATALTLLSAAPASAIFHLVKIREVAPESSPGANDAFVELQLYFPGNNFVSTHTIHVYSSTGADSGPLLLSGPDPPNGQSQRTILIGDAGVSGRDFTRNELSTVIGGGGGAVCFDETEVDCVAWGTFNNSPGVPVGTPAAAIPSGQSLTRTIARGCATALDAADDTDNSAADFSVSARSPRPNSTAPTETVCPTGGGGGGGGGDRTKPNTFITRRPANRTFDRTPTYRFRSNEAGSRFQCKIDGRAYRACSSAFTLPRLSPGRHTFRVRARDRAGTRDPSPAKDFFRILVRR